MKDNWEMMEQAAKILPRKLTRDPNLENSFFKKYGAYSFTMEELSCENLCIIFKDVFDEDLKDILLLHGMSIMH